MVDIFVPPHLGHSQGAEAIAQALGVSRATVMRWKQEGAPICLVGRKYQCRYDELWEWLKKHEKDLYLLTKKRR